MLRLSVPIWLAVTAVSLVSTVALAEPNDAPIDPRIPEGTGRRIAVPTPVDQFVTPHAQISGTIYLERCKGGCTVNRGANDARAMTSTIPTPGAHSISEYRNGALQSGAAADDEWNAVVQCMKEVYSPFNVMITDVKPAAGVSYHAAIIAGIPQEVGLGADILGIAPLAGDCSPQDNVISFSFANAHPQTETVARVQNVCWTAAQESAHAFGLDHQYAFLSDNRSACNDPMTYRVDCGGQKFFRNDNASCGEFQARQCRCGASQNSHLKLLSVFDAGRSIIPPPTVAITTPGATETQLGSIVAATAGSRRGVARVELYLNNYKWAEAKGASFGQNGQPNPAPYGIQVPAGVPNSVVDVKVRAYDDLENYTDSPVLTVTKGAACTSAATCVKGQKCEAGKCFWDPPSGEIGDACTFPQFCLSGICTGTAEQQICTQDCIPGVADSCPSGFACAQTSPGKGICFFPPEDSGCCSTGGDRGVPWAQLVFAMLTLGLLVRPWRRRA
ncbi:MAG TPA: hypothetical protein VN253_05130 [Kofleriaceae bacterium]|nr:hypothetical protein [Kofleriaceae bacterium]